MTEYATGGLASSSLVELMDQQGCYWRWVGSALPTSPSLAQFTREFATGLGAGALLDEAALWRDPLTPERAYELAAQAYDNPDGP